VTLALSVVFGAVGAMWALTHDSETYDLNGIPLSQALWSIAFILPLLRFAPQDSSWIGRTPFLGRAVALVNNRAVTIYLWHNVLIDLSYPIEDKLSAAAPALANVVYNPVWNYFVIWILIAGAVLIFGWVEDVAARRSPRLFPVGPSAAERRAADEAAKETERAEAQTVHSADQLRYPATASRPVAAQTAVHPPAYWNQPPYDQYDQGYGNNAQRGTVYGAPQPRPPREERPYDEGPYGRGDDRTQPYPAQPYPIQPHPPRHRGEE
jgi:hypothetical protein